MSRAWFKTEVPIIGGSFIEGVVGKPNLINPVLATSDVDKDLTYLVYSGLLKYGDNGLELDLAEKIEISEDGLIYTVTLKKDLIFQDGETIEADDVIYTIQKMQSSNISSPKKVNWTGVAVEKLDELSLQIILSNPLSTFISNLTFGIIPQHVWQEVADKDFVFNKYNLNPVGSGQYKVNKIIKDKEENITSIELERFDNHSGQSPFIKNIVFKFFTDSSNLLLAKKNQQIDSFYLFNAIADDEVGAIQYRLPQLIQVFFKQNENNVFSKEVREALVKSVDKNTIAQQLQNAVSMIDGPIPNYFVSPEEKGQEVVNLAEIQAKLEEAGWEKNQDGIYEISKNGESKILRFNLAVLNSSTSLSVAEILKQQWKELGAEVTIQSYSSADIITVINQRDYDAILYGEIINSVDLRAYWHSTQRDIGFNLSNYTNIQVDNLINEIRQSVNPGLSFTQYTDKLQELNNLIIKDNPAVFLYANSLYYYPAKQVAGVTENKILNEFERFNNINNWFIKTELIY